MNKTHNDLIASFAHGIDEMNYTTVMAVGRKFVLFRISGHSTSEGGVRGMITRSYEPVKFILIRKGQWWMSDDAEKREWRGRITRAILINAFKQAEKIGKLETNAKPHRTATKVEPKP